ncbi:hypothetical protein [Planctomycetes bacterium K23_9]|uniref:Cytochrome C n=1 Tax=Stieleria marina TaxID=1930275 RepID=A0A517NVF9_9BACT|nr:hypothetical protein K239x_30970 [Planctomycetes bacterium K23_9]
MPTVNAVSCLLCFAFLVTVGDTSAAPPTGKRKPDASVSTAQPASYPRKLSSPHLTNPIQLHARVISGGVPEGDAAFRELAKLGVKTIITVDGAKPDTETALRHGLRYVHLPHGYDGISEARRTQLAKAVRDLDGPFYFHCHHGKHRSPAAASVACVGAGLMPPSNAASVLALAGTSQNYRGLHQSAATAVPLASEVLENLEVEFVSVATVDALAEAMVEVQRSYDHLQTIAAADWRSPESHPDLDPAHQALLLQEHFRELLRDNVVQKWPEAVMQMLTESAADARRLETRLREWHPKDRSESPPSVLSQIAKRIEANCQNCHQRFRDTPLSEK